MRAFSFALLIAAAPYCAAQPLQVGLASFNMAWAGTPADFKKHLEVCRAPAVNWCNSRARIEKGATEPSPVEKARAEKCQASFEAAAGGAEQAMVVAPCNAYGINAHTSKTIQPSDYQLKLEGLTTTVDTLIAAHGIRVIAFQEIRSEEVIRIVLGKHANRFGVCAAKHNAFQTLAFAWAKELAGTANPCREWTALAVKEDPADPASIRRLRPGLSVDLQIGQSKFAVLSVHLKSSCANLVTDKIFEGHLLTDAAQPCEVLSRQVIPLENAIENIASTSAKFVVMGDFNRRLDEEQSAKPPLNAIRTDGTHPASPNIAQSNGRPGSKYMWQEISDGKPGMVQVPLEGNPTCKGFVGLDHILASETLWSSQPSSTISRKLPVTRQVDQKIETSDHCPRFTQLVF